MKKIIVYMVFCSMGWAWPVMAVANVLAWKVTVISALPVRTEVPPAYCQQFVPNVFVAPLDQLTREGAVAQNGILIKYRTFNLQEQHGLYFTDIDAFLSRGLSNGRPWYTHMYIHQQQLSAEGVADGVWSTPDCKGRWVAQPQQ